MIHTKPTLLFLHGALGVSSDLEPLMEIFRQKGFETLSFNFSGHGLNVPEPMEFRIDLFARDLDAYLKKKKLENVVVFGYSMGGYVALYHKANFEDSSLKMIFTYGTKFNWIPEAVVKELPMLVPETIQEKYPQYATSLKTKHGDRWKQILRSTAHMMQNLEKLDGLTKEDLAGIDVPVVLILGDQDRMVTTEETHLTSSQIHHSQVKTVSHSKHEMEKSNLREIASIILTSMD